MQQIDQSDTIYLIVGDNGNVLGCIICEKVPYRE